MSDQDIEPNDRSATVFCSGGETTLPADFPIYDQSEITVTRTRAGVQTILTLTTDYSVSGAGGADFNVVLAAAALAGDQYDIDGSTVIERVSTFDQSNFKAGALNRELDRVSMIEQELRRDIDINTARMSSLVLDPTVATAAILTDRAQSYSASQKAQARANIGLAALTAMTLGMLFYAGSATDVSALAPNATTTKKFLGQIGDGAAAGAPAWAQLLQADVAGLKTSDAPTFAGINLAPASMAASALSLTQSGAVTTAVPGLNFAQTFSGTPGSNPFAANQIGITDNTTAHLTGVSLVMGVNTWSISSFDQKTAFTADTYLNVNPTHAGQALVAGGFSVRSIAGINTNGSSLFAANFTATGADGSSGGTLIGNEYDLNIGVGATWLNAIGVQCIMGGIAGTAATDVAFVAGQTGGVGWDYFGWWYTNAFKSTSTIIGSANLTNAKFGIDFSTITFTSGGYAYRSPGCSIDPSGNFAAKTTTITSTSATALAVGPQGATSPTLRVTSSVANCVTGIAIIGNASGGGVSIGALGSANEQLTIDAAGSGPIWLGFTSTGNINIVRAINYGGVTLSNAVVGTGPMVLGTNTTLTNPTFTTPTMGVASATSLALSGTAGAGFIKFLTQSANPAAPASGFTLFADANGRLSWVRQSDGFVRSFAGVLTADRVYTWPDASTTIVGTDATQTLSNKTLAATTTVSSLTAAAGLTLFPNGASGAKMTFGSDGTGSENFYVEFFTHDGTGSPGNVYLAGRFLADMPLLNIMATSTVHSGTATATGYKVGANQVVGARSTGWTNQTATASKADLGASPTVAQLAAFCSALDAMLKAHGLTGT